MSSSGVSLLQIPEIPIKYILEYLEFPSILVLRKTCHDLRNFIDYTKPASHLSKILINVYPEFIKISLESRTQNEICIYYKRCIEGCMVKKYHENEEIKRTILDNEDLVTVFCKDFEVILRHQKIVLEEIRIIFNSTNSTVEGSVLESVSKAFKSMKHLLKVKSLYMRVNNQNEILSILPYIEPKPLELIDINDYLERFNDVLNLNEMGQLEQWKQAKQLRLCIDEFQLLPDLSQNIKHFLSINFVFREVSIEELILLKEIFLSSSTLTAMEIYLFYAVVGPRLIERFGQPFVDSNQDDCWFFEIPDTNQFLRITQQSSFDIHFNRIEQSDVPQNVITSN